MKREASHTSSHHSNLPTPPYNVPDVGTPVTKGRSSKSTPSSHTVRNSPPSMSSTDNTVAAPDPAPAPKPKRVRTGCLTCRERHLKCDEGAPICVNCKKSNRKCKRGVRLNFLETTCERDSYILPQSQDWKVTFQDDSRDIASEYEGGFERYQPLEPEPKRQKVSVSETSYDYPQMQAPIMAHQQLPTQQTAYGGYAESSQPVYAASSTQGYITPVQEMQAYAEQAHRQSYDQGVMMPQEPQPAPPLDDRTETLYMQVFVEEVGLWMDSMDADKHFSRLIPCQALREPMLKYALLACGVRHLTLVNAAAYSEEHALSYYNSANLLLMKSLQNPDRDSVLCATTAVILNVYEVMTEKALQRMNHIAGARALIKECRWDGTATGIGGACFWLNVGLELFSCLHFNWGVAWDPDTWGIDMTMNPQHVGGNEEEWTHKILWILAKITNFRSTTPHFQEQTIHAEQLRMHQRHQQWLGLKQFCDKWDKCVPPTMHPMAHVSTYNTSSKSAFPEVWYIKRSTIVARLFYHTAMALLGNCHPHNSIDAQTSQEMQSLRVEHSRLICGIVAHVKDRGVASASIRCLAIAGEVLTLRPEQDEVIRMFDRIKKETGWRVDFIWDDLKEKWGWNNQDYNNGGSAFYQQGTAQMPPIPQQRPKTTLWHHQPDVQKMPTFSSQNPPYQGSYVPPSADHILHSTQVYGFQGLSSI